MLGPFWLSELWGAGTEFGQRGALEPWGAPPGPNGLRGSPGAPTAPRAPFGGNFGTIVPRAPFKGNFSTILTLRRIFETNFQFWYNFVNFGTILAKCWTVMQTVMQPSWTVMQTVTQPSWTVMQTVMQPSCTVMQTAMQPSWTFMETVKHNLGNFRSICAILVQFREYWYNFGIEEILVQFWHSCAQRSPTEPCALRGPLRGPEGLCGALPKRCRGFPDPWGTDGSC